MGQTLSCTLGRILCFCWGFIARRCRCSRSTARADGSRLRAIFKEACNTAGNIIPGTGKLVGEISPSIYNIGEDDSRDILDILDDRTVFNIVEHFSSIGRRGLCSSFDFAWKGKCNFDYVLELLVSFFRKILDDRWHFVVGEFGDKYLCFVGILLEGVNFFTGNFANVVDYVPFLRMKQAFDYVTI